MINDNQMEENIKIKESVYEFNGVQVMLDYDLAVLYGVETKRINEAVKNNPEKFPERYVYRISEEELNSLKSKKSTSNYLRGGSRKGHTIFTEQGVAMLATILKSKVAIQVSIKIMDTFVMMRNYISSNLNYDNRLNNLESKIIDHDNKIYQVLNILETKEKRNHVFFDGQIYDAYSLLIDILSKAAYEIIVIDNYVDKNILDILSNIKTSVVLITKEINYNDINKYNSQYKNIKIIYKNNFHDRFILLDKKKLYHCGASFKDLGKKCFAINEIDDPKFIEKLISFIN